MKLTILFFMFLILVSVHSFSQELNVNTLIGSTVPTIDSFIEFNDGTTGANGGQLNIFELNIDYGKDEYLLKPYLAFGYGFQIFRFSEKARSTNPTLSMNSIYSEIGIKKTFPIQEAKISLLGGVGYQWYDYKIEYQERNISFDVKPNSIKYQLGLQLNFKFLKNVDAIISWRYVFMSSKEYYGTIKTTDYKFYSNSNYQLIAIGIGFNISKIF